MPPQLITLLMPLIEKEFKRQLADPNSSLSKQAGDVFKNFDLGKAVGLGSTAPKASVKHGTEGWQDYRVPVKEVIGLDIAMPVLGDVAQAAGSTGRMYNSMLGNALMLMAQRQNQSKVQSNTSGALEAMGLGKLTRGNIEGMLGDVVSNRLDTIAKTLKANNERARMMAAQINEQPNVGYWQSYSKNSPQATPQPQRKP